MPRNSSRLHHAAQAHHRRSRCWAPRCPRSPLPGTGASMRMGEAASASARSLDSAAMRLTLTLTRFTLPVAVAPLDIARLQPELGHHRAGVHLHHADGHAQAAQRLLDDARLFADIASGSSGSLRSSAAFRPAGAGARRLRGRWRRWMGAWATSVRRCAAGLRRRAEQPGARGAGGLCWRRRPWAGRQSPRRGVGAVTATVADASPHPASQARRRLPQRPQRPRRSRPHVDVQRHDRPMPTSSKQQDGGAAPAHQAREPLAERIADGATAAAGLAGRRGVVHR